MHCLGSVRLSGVRVVTCLGEEGVEGVVAGADGLVGGHLAVGLDAMFEAIKFPARVPDLATGLTHVDRDALALGKIILQKKQIREISNV